MEQGGEDDSFDKQIWQWGRGESTAPCWSESLQSWYLPLHSNTSHTTLPIPSLTRANLPHLHGSTSAKNYFVWIRSSWGNDIISELISRQWSCSACSAWLAPVWPGPRLSLSPTSRASRKTSPLTALSLRWPTLRVTLQQNTQLSVFNSVNISRGFSSGQRGPGCHSGQYHTGWYWGGGYYRDQWWNHRQYHHRREAVSGDQGGEEDQPGDQLVPRLQRGVQEVQWTPGAELWRQVWGGPGHKVHVDQEREISRQFLRSCHIRISD